MQDQLTLWPAEKRCSKCGEAKPIEEFHPRAEQGRTGYRSWCKKCVATPARERANRNWRQKKDRFNAARRAKRLEKGPLLRVWSYGDDDVRRIVRAEKERRRRAAKRAAPCSEFIDPLVVLELDDGVCGICGQGVDPFDFHVDHIVPLARGGEHSYRNTQPAHPVCNLRKGAMVP